MPINTEQKTSHAKKALNWLGPTHGLSGILKGVLFLSLLLNSAQVFSATITSGQSVTLAWIQSSDADVVGYNIYYGMVSRTYTDVVNVGNVTNATIPGLVPDVTYYFSATAYDDLGQESDFSNEIIYSLSIKPAVQVQGMVAGQFVLTVHGRTGDKYDILATQDFRGWTIIGTVTIGADGTSDFTDTNAANFAQRFYRTEANP